MAKNNKNNKDAMVQKGIKDSLWRTVSKSVQPIEGRESLFNQHLEAYLEENDEKTFEKVSLVKKPKSKSHSKSTVSPPTRTVPVFLDGQKLGGGSQSQKQNFKVDLLGFLQHGDSPGVDKRTAQRLHKGRMEIDAKLDLHSHSLEAAHTRLINFVQSSHRAGHRCLLIVTGKGDKGMGVIKQTVPKWLNDTPLRGMVLSFSHAQPGDGGKGALYVLLKRTRDYAKTRDLSKK